MGSIRILSPELVNRIAAGECVERPASAVKELLENALDAGAGRIDVTILDGGRGLIQVVDDGVGMDVDDLALCVRSHATSKIRRDEDLFALHTLGFRGEALPSIGAVSRLTITSRTREADVAQTIRVEAGQISGPAPCSAPPGTRVEVRDLFYSVPARRKFLRTNQTEMAQISEQLARIALAHPGIAFSLRHDKRVFYDLPPTDDVRKRIADVFGRELAEVLLPVRREGGGVRVEGWVSPPKESRGSGKWEYVFVNGRYVRDRFVSHAVKEAYRSLIDPSRFPVAFLFIAIDPAQVDVNVHPTKIEVRWRDSNYIHGQVLAALREKFLSTNLDHTLEARAMEEEACRARIRQAMVDFFTRGGQSSALPGAAEARRHEGAEGRLQGSGVAVQNSGRAESAINPPSTIIAQAAVRNPQSLAPPAPRPPGPPAPSTFVAESDHAAAPHAAFQVHNMYIVAETPDGLMIIDQHALHERILYEELRRRIAERPLESQRLLLPEIVAVPPACLEALETHAELLARLGLELTAAGPQRVALHAFPSLLERVDRERFVRDLLGRLSEAGVQPEPESLIHELLDLMACKAAVKFGDALTPAEVAALLERRTLAERSSHCPHGRPTTLHLSLRDLERQFGRR